MRLLLEESIGLMREEGELDKYLPVLLSAMGHNILFSAQKGPRQHGVDIVSIGVDEDGKRKLFLWLVKCGDIGRGDWNTGEQSVRQSLEDIKDFYLPTHIAPEHKTLKKKVVVVTNGEFKTTIAGTLAQYLKQWTKSTRAEAGTVNGSKLAEWSEEHLLNEYALSLSNRSLFRRMLANVSYPETCLSSGMKLVDALVDAGTGPAKSKGLLRKQKLTAFRTLRTALKILALWGENEGNLLAPYKLYRHAQLRLWSGFHGDIGNGNKEIVLEWGELLMEAATAGAQYHKRLESFYRTKDAFAHRAADSLLVAERVFEEIGGLGYQGYFWAYHALLANNELFAMLAQVHAMHLENLLTTHGSSASPCYDIQAIDIHAGLLCLAATSRFDTAKWWLNNLVERLNVVTQSKDKKFWPLNASFAEALQVRHGDGDIDPSFLNTCALIPLLAIWSAALDVPGAYPTLVGQIAPRMSGTSMNVWNSDTGYDAVVGSWSEINAHGVGEVIIDFPATPLQYLLELIQPLVGVESIAESQWFQASAPYIPLMAALHWRCLLPREMLVKQIFSMTEPLRRQGAAANPPTNSEQSAPASEQSQAQ